jgi:nitrate/nitrite-specific signal transduction histidine kinase
MSLVLAIMVAILLVRSMVNTPPADGDTPDFKGQFWHRLPSDSGDEFGELARAFNTMALRLSGWIR